MGDRKGDGISNDEARGGKECGVKEDTEVVCHMRGAKGPVGPAALKGEVVEGGVKLCLVPCRLLGLWW